MKKIFLIISMLFLFGCFLDKAEKTLLNCADSSYSENLVNNFNRNFFIDGISLSLWMDKNFGIFVPKDILSKEIIKLKKAGFSLAELNNWLDELKTSGISSTNKDIVDFLINEKNKTNKKQDDLLKLEITDKLKDNLYELGFKECEKKRNESSKIFDLKWEKPKFYRAEFR
jgi:DNA-binding transcriptional MerR regulator